MCLIALAGALAFAFAVPRRSANDLARDVALLPGTGRPEPERSAA